VEISLNTQGRANPAITVAEACIPGVPEKTSITNPVKNDRKSSSHDDMSKGSSRMNMI
jgi:hypothetical protein